MAPSCGLFLQVLNAVSWEKFVRHHKSPHWQMNQQSVHFRTKFSQKFQSFWSQLSLFFLFEEISQSHIANATLYCIFCNFSDRFYNWRFAKRCYWTLCASWAWMHSGLIGEFHFTPTDQKQLLIKRMHYCISSEAFLQSQCIENFDLSNRIGIS